jgi:hypothetical protein
MIKNVAEILPIIGADPSMSEDLCAIVNRRFVRDSALTVAQLYVSREKDTTPSIEYSTPPCHSLHSAARAYPHLGSPPIPSPSPLPRHSVHIAQRACPHLGSPLPPLLR